jgi:hypothetical protein
LKVGKLKSGLNMANKPQTLSQGQKEEVSKIIRNQVLAGALIIFALLGGITCFWSLANQGNPDMNLATTCHAERMNLSVRLFNRRFTRKTFGYSKKLDNLRHSVAILAAHFNFCRVHSAHERTPAQAASLTDHAWTIKELIGSTI